MGSQSVELDIVLYTDEGAVIGIEVEKSKDNASPLRARYHASVLDCDFSYPKEKWSHFPEMYVVFICEKDVLKTNELINHIQRYMINGMIFQDKLHIIYLNASKQDETPLGKLMHDMMCNDPDEMYYEVLRKRVSYLKKQKGGKKTMCEALEELINEAKKEGEDIGEKRGEERGKLIGEERGEIKKLMKLLLKKFPNKNLEWIKDCSKTQLERIDDYIFLNISYNDFYKLIHS